MSFGEWESEEILPPTYLAHARSAFFQEWGGVHFSAPGTKIVLDTFSGSRPKVGSPIRKNTKKSLRKWGELGYILSMANEKEIEVIEGVEMYIKGVKMIVTVNNLDPEDAHLIEAELEDGTPVDVETIKPEDFIQGVFDWHADWI
jgi:hypothetical protein